jgi:hypothetical protein
MPDLKTIGAGMKPETGFRLYSEVVVLVGMVACMGLYAFLRYGGYWGETDTYIFTLATQRIYDSNQLVPPGPGLIYPNGYGYQALLVFLTQLTGVELALWQRMGASLLLVWVVLPAWLCYRELTGGRRGALLATLLLFIQPEFLFPLLRGTHEKFSRAFMLLALYVLLRSFRSRHRPVQFAGLVLAFYLVAYALITFNNLMAISFISAIALALGFHWILLYHHRERGRLARAMIERLVSVVLVLIGLGFLFSFYLYPPAQHDLLVLNSMVDRVAALFLGMERTTNPYSTIDSGWVSLPVYFTVSLANWLLLAASLVLWGQQTVRRLRGQPPARPHGELLWSLYSAFLFLAGISVIVDMSGALAGNLQHRFFPSLAMFAAPLLAQALMRWYAVPRPRMLWRRGAVWLGVAGLACLSLLKATNEPIVSNKWLFHTPAELQAVAWSRHALAGRTLWTDFDERLTTGIGIREPGIRHPVKLEYRNRSIATRDVLVSQVTRLRSQRLDRPLPVESDSFITYDNGEVQIYHLRPRTPFQP